MPLSRKVVALAAGMVSVLCLPAAANAGSDAPLSRPRGPALVAFPPAAADEVRFTVDAYARHDRPGPFPTASWGTAYVRHYFAAPKEVVWYSMKVDCLMVAGGSPYLDDSPALRMCTAPPPFFSVREGGYSVSGANALVRTGSPS